jgi:7-keto-8-aminopelargonate synthetase-like enzyme
MSTASCGTRPGVEERRQLAGSTWSLARTRGLVLQAAEDERFDGRTITLDGRRLINFGSCSYLGLETDARLKTAACEAVLRYGVQFSASRAYVTAPLYREFESLLSEMVGGAPVVLAPTTSLGHLSALPVLVDDHDAVLYDIKVHASVQAALPELRLRGVPCEPVRHNRLDRLEERVAALACKHRRVFYLCDGIYSMHGDVLDVDSLFGVLDRQPSMFAYVDDAHGVSWSGRNGAGTVLGRHCLHPRMAVIFGLSKSFAAAGGAIVLPNQELAERILTEGRTLIFSGASAKIHLSDELPTLQARLISRIQTFDQAARNHGLAVTYSHRSPIRFIQVGEERAAVDLATGLLVRGYFVNIAWFPAVPQRRAGVRLMLNAHQTIEDIQGLVAELAACLGPTRTATRVAAPAPSWGAAEHA